VVPFYDQFKKELFLRANVPEKQALSKSHIIPLRDISNSDRFKTKTGYKKTRF
jgi:hypothetical protein